MSGELAGELTPDGWYDLTLRMTADKKLATQWFAEAHFQDLHAKSNTQP